MASKPAPPLSIPQGNVSVKVSAIDSTLWLSAMPTEYIYAPPIKGFGRVQIGCWSLFIEHPSGRNLIYDLGVRKDIENIPPACGLKEFKEKGFLEELRVEKNVSEILEEGGVDLGSIEGVIWSHFHWDHTGDVSRFPGSTKLIMGEGAKAAYVPGFPTDPGAHTLDVDFEGREVVEVDFEVSGFRIGEFRAQDYFGDGSFFLLDSPGHTIGHVNALARTSVEPPEFVHMCGDSAHHCGEIRPSEYVPLPDEISPSPFPALHPNTCPASLFANILRNGSKQDHILELIDIGIYEKHKYAMIYDQTKLRDTIRKVEGFDANANVFTILAHDWSLKGIIEEWPKNLNGWSQKGWRDEGFWKFLGDFKGIEIGTDGEE